MMLNMQKLGGKIFNKMVFRQKNPYVNYGIGDGEYEGSEEDKKLNKEFYKS